jgi:hypothetical protein
MCSRVDHGMTLRSRIVYRIPGSLRRGHGEWRADANNERDQEDTEPLLEREL